MPLPSIPGCASSGREIRKRANGAHRSWRGLKRHVDETHVRVRRRWRYLWRAVDQFGQLIDRRLTARRTAKAARAFLQQAWEVIRAYHPLTIVTDKAHSYAMNSVVSCGRLLRSFQGAEAMVSSSSVRDEFKRSAVAKITARGRPVREVSERLGVSPYSLCAWKEKFAKPGPKAARSAATANCTTTLSSRARSSA